MDPEDRLLQAAERHKKRAGKAAPVERSEESRRREILEASLGDVTGPARAIEMVCGGLVFVAPTVAAVLLFGNDLLDSGYRFAAVVMVSLAAVGVFLFARERAAVALDRRRVKRLGFGFDARHYLEQLSLPRNDGPVVVFIHFAAVLDANARGLVANAARGFLPELASAGWDDDRVALRLATAPQVGVVSVMTSMGASRWYSNAPAHKAAMRIFRRVVRRLNAARAVKRVEIELAGSVSSPLRD